MKRPEFFGISLVELLRIFAFPIAVLIVHAFLAYPDLYRKIEWVDIPMHFIGGVAIGASYSLLLKKLEKKGHFKAHKLVFFAFVVTLVAFTAMVWEFLEFILDLIDNAMRQPSLFNTMQDLLLGIAGGVAGYLLYASCNSKSSKN
ncbi:hypothetical protein HY637_01015 [Candidatus Woesearchaeota archaeon]|nr:hypothetical protein [Candidatus Woesearchaeota archaeon]